MNSTNIKNQVEDFYNQNDYFKKAYNDFLNLELTESEKLKSLNDLFNRLLSGDTKKRLEKDIEINLKGNYYGSYFKQSVDSLYDFPSNIEGWKVHIPVDDESELFYILYFILPELERLRIVHKVVSLINLQNQNNSDQQGKAIVIYPDSLLHLNKFSKRIKIFLLSKSKFEVITDKNIGGRVFVRYTGFSSDYIYNPIEKELSLIEREKGCYKPNWIPEPISLKEIFLDIIPNDKLSFESRNTKLIYEENNSTSEDE